MTATGINAQSNYLEYLQRIYHYQPQEPEPFTSDLLGPPLDPSETIEMESRGSLIHSLTQYETTRTTALAVSELAMRLRIQHACVILPTDANVVEPGKQLKNPIDAKVVFVRDQNDLLAGIVTRAQNGENKNQAILNKALLQKSVHVIRISKSRIDCRKEIGFFPNVVDAENIRHMMRRFHAMQLMESSNLAPKNICILKAGPTYFFIQERAQTNFLQLIQEKLTFIPLETLAHIALMVVQSVLHLHKQNMIHRDIKFENFLVQRVDNRLLVLLTDFEFCCFLSDEEALNESPGTFSYVPPDFIRCHILKEGNPFVFSTASDVWAVGIILYAIYHKTLPEIYLKQQDWGTILREFEAANKTLQALQTKARENRVLPGFEQVSIQERGREVTVTLADLDKRRLTECIYGLQNYHMLLSSRCRSAESLWKFHLEMLPKRADQIQTLGDIASAMMQEDPQERMGLQQAFELISSTPPEQLFGKPPQQLPVELLTSQSSPVVSEASASPPQSLSPDQLFRPATETDPLFRRLATSSDSNGSDSSETCLDCVML